MCFKLRLSQCWIFFCSDTVTNVSTDCDPHYHSDSSAFTYSDCNANAYRRWSVVRRR